MTTLTRRRPGLDSEPPGGAPPRRSRLGGTPWWSYALLAALALLYIYPFLVQIATSFKTEPEAATNPLGLIPANFTTEAYQRLFQFSDYLTWGTNSFIVTLFVTAGRVFFDSLAGYALARMQFRGRSLVFVLLVAVMAVPSVVLLIPKFLVINQLGMYDSYSGMIIPLMADAAGVFIMKNFFESIPVSVEEQARIDGAGVFRTFWSIVLPMAVPAVMTITILSFQGSWNELNFIVATQDPDLATSPRAWRSWPPGSSARGPSTRSSWPRPCS